MSGEDNIKTIQRLYEAFGRGDVGLIIGGTMPALLSQQRWHDDGRPSGG